MPQEVVSGRCFCGAVHIEARGPALAAGYCHCQDCREWSGSPVTTFVMWPFDAVSIVRGDDTLKLAGRVPETPRGWCGACGGHVGAFRAEHEQPHAVLCPHIFPTLDFRPTMHLFCDEAVVAIDDDLPKYRGLPEVFGGTGELMMDSGAS